MARSESCLKEVDSFADDLVNEGIISSDQLSVAQVSRENLGEDLGTILVKKNFITEQALLKFLSRHIEIPYISLEDLIIEPSVVRHVPLPVARRYKLIVFRKSGSRLHVAMADPKDKFALDELAALVNCEIVPYLASITEINQSIEKHYHLLSKETKTKGLDEEVELVFSTQEEAWSAEKYDELQEMASGGKIVSKVNSILFQAYQEKASDIHVEPSRDALKIRYRIDGLLEEKHVLPMQLHLPFISRIKILSGLDIAERRMPQDGRVSIKLRGTPLDLRISTYPTLYGEKVVIRLLSRAVAVGIEDLGFLESTRQEFVEIMKNSHGIFLVTGPTGSGKSTTLYAALSRLNVPERNIVSIEDPIENDIDGINQAQVNIKAGVTFASALRSILRQDPDIIMIGEIRDRETADIAVRSAITGHLVLSTLHTNTAIGAITRLTDLGVEPFLIGSSLQGLLAQRLVRKICDSCREEVVPDFEKIKKMGFPLTKAYRGMGCRECRLTGFRGRFGIFELITVTDKIKEMIEQKISEEEILSYVRKQGVQSIRIDGLHKVQMGLTTLEEVLRVTQEEG